MLLVVLARVLAATAGTLGAGVLRRGVVMLRLRMRFLRMDLRMLDLRMIILTPVLFDRMGVLVMFPHLGVIGRVLHLRLRCDIAALHLGRCRAFVKG